LKPAWILGFDILKTPHTVNHTVKDFSHNGLAFADQRRQARSRFDGHLFFALLMICNTVGRGRWALVSANRRVRVRVCR
jgi:hypothetical protein